MKKWVAVAALAAALFLLVRENFVLEDDPVQSLRGRDSVAARVFDRYHEDSVFTGRIFVDYAGLDGSEEAALDATLAEAGYRKTKLFRRPSPEDILSLSPLLPPGEVERRLSDAAVEARAEETASWALLPGGGAYLAQVERDPLGLGSAFVSSTLATLGHQAPTVGTTSGIRAFESPSPIDYDNVGRVYRALQGLPGAHFIGGDFFAYENYEAAQRDVLVCSILSVVLNVGLFLLFTRRFKPIVLLAVGSLVSYLSGLLVVGLFYGRIFAVVLAFTSTFVGFNNEYLVHLSALPQGSRRKSLLGITSAIGTTLIGFVLLLFGRSVMVRQIALASLGGMAGFLVVLFLFRGWLNEVRFRTFRWPKLGLRPGPLLGLAGAAAILLVVLPHPSISTRIDEFRVQSPALEAQAEWFSERLGEAHLGRVVAAPVEGDALEAFEALTQAGVVAPEGHPLLAFRPETEQAANLARLRRDYPAAVAKLRAALEEKGLRLDLDGDLPERLEPVDGWTFLQRMGELTPAKWAASVDGRRYLFASASEDAAHARLEAAGLIPMSPQIYYDDLLTTLSRELGLLFLLGLVAMMVYLVVLHRRPLQVLYVFLPLMVAGVAVLLIFGGAGGHLNAMHFVGFALVIALATDYASVAMSTEHHEVEMSKILLTVLSTLGTFGVLLLAEHPVLRDLGGVVALGCIVAAVIALFLKPVRTPSSPQGEAHDDEAPRAAA